MIHHVFACKTNIGDWLSALAIQALLSPEPVVEHLCDESYRAATIEKLSTLGEAGIIVIGGGGLLMDYFDPFWRSMEAIARVTPTVIWGVGLCDHENGASRPDLNVLRSVFSSAKLASVRDQLSMDFLRGYTEGPVACPAMSLFDSASGVGYGVLHAHHRGLLLGDRYETVVTVAKQFAAQTGRSFQEVHNRIPHAERNQMERTLQQYREADLIVSSRLHGCIIGLAMGKKVLALSGDRKVDSFMKAAGLEDWIWRGQSPESLTELLEALPEQPGTSDFVHRTKSLNQSIAARVRTIGGF